MGLTDAVGLNDDGSECANTAIDQGQIGELLDAFAQLPGGAGGWHLNKLNRFSTWWATREEKFGSSQTKGLGIWNLTGPARAAHLQLEKEKDSHPSSQISPS